MCGNWGLLCLAEAASQARRRGESFPQGLEALLSQLLAIVEMRGAQAGGVNVVLGGRRGDFEALRVRGLKPKRGDLRKVLFRRLRFSFWLRTFTHPRLRWPRHEGSVLAQGHSRFGTSSAPAVHETHPHQWSPARQVPVWTHSPEQGWTRKMQSYSLTITHNGDFDAWRPYRETMVDVGTLGMWLDRVLGVRHGAHGDSPKIAGVMELLVCQGVWLHAVRLAYHLHVACHVDQASGWTPLAAKAPYTVPDIATFRAWADVLDAEFAHILQCDWTADEHAWHPLDQDGYAFELFVQAAVDTLQSGQTASSLKPWIPKGKVDKFVRAAAVAFRDNDLLAAGTAFLRRAEGTFGMTLTCTLWPQTVVMAAKGQPVSVGFGGVSESWAPSLAVWTSEVASLRPLVGEQQGGVKARLDLDDQWGEVLQLSIRSLGPPPPACEASKPLKDDPGFAVQLKEGPADGGVLLHAIGIHFGTELQSEEVWEPVLMTADSFRSRLTWLIPDAAAEVAGTENTASQELESKDPVAQDLKQLPALLSDVDLCWSDPQSMNRLSAGYFAELLLQRARLKDSGGAAGMEVDLLVVGIENSLWLAQQFCADLSRIFPGIRAVALSSNVALGLLQSGPGQMNPYNFVYGPDNFRIGLDTMGLAVSHSGTTYPTVWAARFLRKRTQHVFSLSSSFDCLLSVSIGQSPGQSFTRRLFSSMAGVRPAEAATAATVAMHHTLSHLLLHCAAQATSTRLPSLQDHTRFQIVAGTAQERDPQVWASPTATVPWCSATPDAVKDMQRVLLTLYWGVCSSCGVSENGKPVDSKLRTIHEELRRAGHRWSHHITEGYWATFVPAAYVLITVVGGIPPVTSLGGLLLDSWALDEEPSIAMAWLLRLLDALLYVFMSIIVAMIYRICTGRRLWARFTTRTLLVVESTVNYKLLRAYASKLLALSWRFATLSIAGQNGTDHFVHEYTHKAQSDVLLAVGLPDGRLHTAASAEACILMSVQQAKFIKRQGKGIEVVSLGHNPWSRPGLCAASLTLPTRRPLFAGEQILMRDCILPSAGYGSHGMMPTVIMQRWSDLLERGMDPMGMPGIQLSLQALGKLTQLDKKITFSEALRLLHQLLEEQRIQAQAERVPLSLDRFLARYLTEHPSRTTVMVHSPNRNYANPRGQTTGSPHSADKPFFINLTPLACPGTSNDDDFRKNLSKSLTSEKQAADAVMGCVRTKSDNSMPTDGSMEPDEFLAMVNGNEMQDWVRSLRNRWNMIRSVRGLLAPLAEERRGRQHAMTAVLAWGITLADVLSAWKRLTSSTAPESKATQLDSPTLVQEACLNEGMRTLKRRSTVQDGAVAMEEVLAPDSSVLPVGQSLVKQGIREAAVLDALGVAEAFHEARVGSAERLVGWYVMFHAMVKPSSRLPFLWYDLGRTESRLRVASTPAPVAVHAGSLSSSPENVFEV